MIGSFGTVAFEVSTSRVKTFDEFKRQNQAKFGTHELLGKKPKLEYIAPGLDSITFQLVFSVSLGLNPAKEIEAFRDILNKGEYHQLVVGKKPLGYFVIESLSEAWKHIDNHGNVLWAALDVSLKEYFIDTAAGEKVKDAIAKEQPKGLDKTTKGITAAAQKVGLSTGQTQALAKVSLAAIKNPVAAMKGLNGFLGTLSKIDKLAKNQLNSFKILGLSVPALLKKKKTNPGGMIIDVLAGIETCGRSNRTSVVKQLFGTSSKGTIIPLAKQRSSLQKLFSSLR